MISMNNSNNAPKMEQVKHWINVQEKPSQNIGANNMNVNNANIKLSKNCPINVDTYVLVKKANLPSGLFLKVLPIVQFIKLFNNALHIKAIVLLNKINHVPLNILLKALDENCIS